MNWLLIVAVLILAGNIVWGFNSGLFRVIYSMVAWILILAVVTLVTPYVTDALTEYTNIDERIEENCKDRLHELVQGTAADDAADTDALDGAQSSALENLGLQMPESLLNKLLDTGGTAELILEESGLYDTVAQRASALAVQGISYILVFLIAVIVCKIISSMLKLVDRIPVVGGVNHFLGGIAGAVKGMVWIWLIFAFVALGSATSIGRELVGLIYESDLLLWLYQNNFVLTILLAFL